MKIHKQGTKLQYKKKNQVWRTLIVNYVDARPLAIWKNCINCMEKPENNKAKEQVHIGEDNGLEMF